MRTKSVATLSLLCFLVTSTLTGCATFRAGSDTIAEKTGLEKSTAEITTGVGLGVIGGGLVGQIVGGTTKSTLIGALLGGLAGGLVAAQDAKDRDLQAAEKLAQQINLMGIITEKPTILSSIKEEEIVEKDGTQKENIVLPTQKAAKSGEIKKVAYFSAIQYPVPQVSIKDKSPTLSATLNETGKFAISRDTRVQIFVEHFDPDQGKWLAGEIKKGFGKAKNPPKITIKKIPIDEKTIISVVAENSLKA